MKISVSDAHTRAVLACAFILGFELLCEDRCRGARRHAVAARRRSAIVPVVKAARADLASDLVLTAEFEPFQQVDVMAKVAGYVRSIKVDIGDRVREGQVLATLEIPEMEDDLTKAAAAIDQAECRNRDGLG